MAVVGGGPAVPGLVTPRGRRARQNRRIAVAVVLGVAALVGLGVAAGVAHRPRGEIAVATRPFSWPWSNESYAGVGLDGTLRAERTGAASACFWLEGQGGTRADLVLPHGWSATADLTLLDAAGDRVASPGEHVVGGGAALRPSASVAHCPAGDGFEVLEPLVAGR